MKFYKKKTDNRKKTCVSIDSMSSEVREEIYICQLSIPTTPL